MALPIYFIFVKAFRFTRTVMSSNNYNINHWLDNQIESALLRVCFTAEHPYAREKFQILPRISLKFGSDKMPTI